MFEIGSSLQEQRERMGLELGRVAADMRMRTRQLAALENERFDALPARAYTRAFLREYAEYLGLDGQRFLDEYDARFPDVLEQPLVPARPSRPVRLKPYAIAAAGLTVLVLVGLLAWRSGGERTTTPTPATPPPPAQAASGAVPVPAAPQRPSLAKLVLSASFGRCWLEAHVGSREGRTIYSATLETGERARFVGHRLWIRLGAPWNLTATLNGKLVSLPERTANILVTPRGLTFMTTSQEGR
ncbi:MAG: helix-turn-helix domain-containing protein [Gaiellaceae bacterium]